MGMTKADGLEISQAMQQLPENVEWVLKQADQIAEIAKLYSEASNFLYLGRGVNFPVALEGARKGVTCNALVLGVFDGGSFYEVAPEFRERIIKRMAMRRAGDPQELSNVLVFLASEESSFITGETIEVSGGASLFTF